MPRVTVEAVDDARIAPYRELMSRGVDDGLFIVEGNWLVERLLASEYQTHSVLIDERKVGDHNLRIPDEIPLYVAPAEVVSQIVGFDFHRGVLACGHRPLPRDWRNEEAFSTSSWLTVACINIADPANLGGILRNCAAFGVDNVLLGPGCCDFLSRRSLRVSMGTALKLSVFTANDLSEIMSALRTEFKADLTATVLGHEAEPLDRYDKSQRTVLLLGSEGHGLPDEWISRCNRRLTIPMQLDTDSLNVAVACGILLHWLQC